eukprot:CAMPEP_0182443078 /NCGR_PEP_ID=MMETSP1172-20130603/1913_1 /TAXON_ID=708627 /ORGANISM="Timspurckia oligopyrenoides, Strain CCMP3278" /LENGTH=331 /DNA_ID=CAMNT_0024638245 /DNA_START=68 /DNA_END=1063 /DNA_ORIENTATION=-
MVSSVEFSDFGRVAKNVLESNALETTNRIKINTGAVNIQLSSKSGGSIETKPPIALRKDLVAIASLGTHQQLAQLQVLYRNYANITLTLGDLHDSLKDNGSAALDFTENSHSTSDLIQEPSVSNPFLLDKSIQMRAELAHRTNRAVFKTAACLDNSLSAGLEASATYSFSNVSFGARLASGTCGSRSQSLDHIQWEAGLSCEDRRGGGTFTAMVSDGAGGAPLLSTYYTHTISQNLRLAALGTYSRSSDHKALILALEYHRNQGEIIRTRLHSEGLIAIALSNTFAPIAKITPTLTLSAQVNSIKIHDSPRVGIALSLDDSNYSSVHLQRQ